MKKLLLTMVMFLSAGAMLLSSCDADGSSSIVGTWQASEMMVIFPDGGVSEQPLPDSWTERITFNADNTYSYAWTKDGRSGSGSGTWEKVNGNLALTEDDETIETRYNVDGNSFSILSTVPEGEAELLFFKVE